MPLIPEEYPTKVSDGSLVKRKSEYPVYATVAGRPGTDIAGSGYWQEMVTLGLSTLQPY